MSAVGRPNTPLHLAAVGGKNLPAAPERIEPPKPGLADMPMQVACDPLAVAVWQEYGQRLLKTGYMSEIYGHTFALFCVSVARWQRANADWIADGARLVVEVGENKYKQQHPLLSIVNKAMEQVEKYGSKFGMSPTDIARATATQGDLFGNDADNPASEFFK